jgi:small subunit ribosomal protein S3
MGQKIHPVGIRLGITKISSSRWFTKNTNYAFFIREDQHIRHYVNQTYNHCIISEIKIERRMIGVRVRISAAQVKPLLGLGRGNIEKLRCSLQKECQHLRQDYLRHTSTSKIDSIVYEKTEVQVFVKQVICPEKEAQCLADFIVTELEKRTPFRRILRISQERAEGLGQTKGLRIQVSGRLNGAEIARTEWIRRGRVPLHTFSADLDYACKTASTIYGLLGIKVWIYRS